MAGGCGAGRWGWGCSAAQMGRRSRVIPCGTAPWRVPGAGRLRGRRAPRGWGRVAASRCPDRSGGASSGAGGQNRAGRRGRSPPRRSRRRPGAVGDATRGPPGSPRAQEPQASKGSRGQSPRPLLLFRPTKDGRSHTLPALVVQPLRRRCGRCAWARSGSSFRSRGAAGNRVPQRCCLSFPTPVAELSRARLHSACGPCAASDQSPLLAAQHPGGIAIARNGRTSSLPLCYHRAAPFSEYKVLHANLFIESY